MTLPGGFAQDEEEAYALGSLAVSLEDDVSVIALTGEIDLAMGEDLDVACRQVLDRGLPVRIDASQLQFIDSSGLGFLARIIKANPGGRRPEIVGASPRIVDTITIGGLADLVDLT
jgi:anti-anti-sigma factor